MSPFCNGLWVGLLIGGMIGVIVMCLAQISGDDDGYRPPLRPGERINREGD